MRSIDDKKAWGKPLADMVEGCISPVLARYGFGEADIVTCWADIVGGRIAAASQPLILQWPRPSPTVEGEVETARLPATLVLRVDGGFALELQHLAPLVIQRINTHLGWRCVGRIALRQGPLLHRAPPKPRRPPPDPQRVALAIQATEGITDDRLREALIRLGTHVLGRRGGADIGR